MSPVAIVTAASKGMGAAVARAAFPWVPTRRLARSDADFPVSAGLRTAPASFTKLYAERYAKAGIRMNNLLPGFIDSLPEKAERTACIPMERYGTVSEVARTAALLLSDDAGYITGQNILVDGGLVRGL